MVDVQVDFVEGGAMAVGGTRAVVPALARLVAAYRAAGLPVVHVVRLYEGDDVDLVRRGAIVAGAPVVRPGTGGSQLLPELLPDGAGELDAALLLSGRPQELGPHEVALWKPRWSAFHRTSLEDLLRGWDVDTLVAAGCNFPHCPRATVVDASQRDLRVVVVRDATSQVTEEGLRQVGSLGVAVVETDDVVAAVGRQTRDAPHDEVQAEAVLAYWERVRHLARVGQLDVVTGRGVASAVPPPAWSFGDSPRLADELLALVLAGRKTATTASLLEYEDDGEPLPRPGELSILLDGRGRPRALVRTASVEVVPFADVTAGFAAAEGEGDRSLASWREEHARYFRRVLGDDRFDERMPVVCERFELLHPTWSLERTLTTP
ncbi:isochorismatase family protein [Luteimicrobium sp. DT211]|uniref:isochorismatase family protein n=1 Tax=Luteimicrobium sp. DT211 TaxID=3393412 RepID=UPI003CF8C879